MPEEPKTCGTCRHWRRQPADPMALGVGVHGECREGPPSAGVILAPSGQTVPYALYPVVPATFPACGRHAPAESPPA